MSRPRFTPAQQLHIDELIERRLAQQRRKLEWDHECATARLRIAARDSDCYAEALTLVRAQRDALRLEVAALRAALQPIEEMHSRGARLWWALRGGR